MDQINVEQALEGIKTSPISPETLSSHNGTTGTAETLANLDTLALSKYKSGKYIEAVELLKVAYDIRNKSLGFNNLATLTTVNNLAATLGRLGKYHEAEQLFHQVLTIREDMLGESHVDTLVTVNHIGVVLKQLFRLAESEEFLNRAYRGFEQTLGSKHVRTAECAYNLGILNVQKGNRKKAQEFFKIAHTGLADCLGAEHPHTNDAMHWEIKCNLSSKEIENIRPVSSRSRSRDDSSEEKEALTSSSTPTNEKKEEEKKTVDLEHYISRDDWVTSTYCTLCFTTYHVFNREHHCRVCSRSVCIECWGNKKSLVLEFSDTIPSKICNTCAQQGF